MSKEKVAKVQAEKQLLAAQAEEDRAWDGDGADRRQLIRATENRFRAELDLGRSRGMAVAA